MILSYHNLGEKKRHRIKATVTTEHSASSYGQPVIVLEDAFQYVRKTFFPLWDRKKQWKVEYRPEFKKWHERGITEQIKRKGLKDKYPFKIRIDAICQEFRHYILFYRIPQNNNALYAILIHEICHVKTSGHGKKWVEKMDTAYSKALNDVSKNLAKRIKLDLIKEDLGSRGRKGGLDGDLQKR